MLSYNRQKHKIPAYCDIDIYRLNSRKIVPETDQCSVTFAEERHAVIFRDINMDGCAETETYCQTNDDSETDSDDIEIVGAV